MLFHGQIRRQIFGLLLVPLGKLGDKNPAVFDAEKNLPVHADYGNAIVWMNATGKNIGWLIIYFFFYQSGGIVYLATFLPALITHKGGSDNGYDNNQNNATND